MTRNDNQTPCVAEQALRDLLSRCSALRRDKLLAGVRLDPDKVENIVNRMVSRGEIEVLRPMFARAEHPCYYRLCRAGEERFMPRHRRPRPLPAGRLFDAIEMGLA